MNYFLSIFKKLKPFDLTIVAIVIICVLVLIITLAGKRATSAKRIEGNTKIEVDVFFRGVTITSNNSPFVEGDETFVTIRNVPYTKLKIKRVQYEKKKAMIPNAGAKNGYILVDDVTTPFQFDFLVTVEDDAKITKDGAVMGGNKVKIGLPITLEGVDYRLNGLVANVTKSTDMPQEVTDNIADEIVREIPSNEAGRQPDKASEE